MPDSVLEEATRVAHSVRAREASFVSLGATAKQQHLKEIYSLAHKAHNIAQAWSHTPEKVDIETHGMQLSRLAKELLRGH